MRRINFKKLTIFTLAMTLVLSVCACGSKEESAETGNLVEEAETEEIVSDKIADEVEEEIVEEETGDEVKENEVKEEPFKEQVLWDNEYCKIIQTSAFVYDKENETGECGLVIENKTDGVLKCRVGSTVYVNDVRSRAYYAGGSGAFSSNNKYVDVDKRASGSCWIKWNAGNAAERSEVGKVDIDINIFYDNEETGVYQEHFLVLDETFSVYQAEPEMSDKYEPTGDEVFLIDDEICKAVVTDCVEGDEDYEIKMYIENKTDDYLSFHFGQTKVTSDQQEIPLYLANGGDSYLDMYQEMVSLAAGKGGFVTASFGKDRIDGYAKDISEVVQLSMRMAVAACKEDAEIVNRMGELTDLHLSSEEYDIKNEFTIVLTRDQLID